MKLIKLTAKGRYHSVYVGDERVSRHITEREAIESATEQALRNPGNSVRYKHEYEVEVGLTDAGIAIAQDYSTADQPPTITSTPSPSFTEGTAATYDMKQHVSDDGLSTVTYGLTNTLPNGLVLNTSTGILSYDGLGSPSVSAHTLTATDAVGVAESNSFNVSINALSTGDNAYFDLISVTPASGSPDVSWSLRQQTQLDDFVGTDDWIYDASQDAARFDLDGSTGLGSNEAIKIQPSRGGNITSVNTAIQLFYCEFKFAGTVQQWKDWVNNTPSLDWKHLRVHDAAGDNASIEWRARFSNDVASDKVAHTNWRFYSQGGVAPAGNNQGPDVDFDVDANVWTYYWFFLNFNTDQLTFYVADENRAPQLVYTRNLTRLDPHDNFQILCNTSTNEGVSNEGLDIFARNFVCVNGITNPQAVIDQF